MGVMKRNLLAIVLLSAFCIPTFATVTSSQMTDPGYMINAGWSEATSEEVTIEKNRKNGKPIEPLYNSKRNNKFVNFMRNVYSYLDPSIDTEQRAHHDIHQSPSWKDY